MTTLCLLLLTSKLATSMLGADADRRPAHAQNVDITSRADDYVPRAAETDNSTIAELAFVPARLPRIMSAGSYQGLLERAKAKPSLSQNVAAT